jgi:hypothetical protein
VCEWVKGIDLEHSSSGTCVARSAQSPFVKQFIEQRLIMPLFVKAFFPRALSGLIIAGQQNPRPDSAWTIEGFKASLR